MSVQLEHMSVQTKEMKTVVERSVLAQEQIDAQLEQR
jgi:hypothetical protein